MKSTTSLTGSLTSLSKSSLPTRTKGDQLIPMPSSRIIFHDLLRAHGASYTMQHMRPMYEDMDYGSGVKQRRIQRLQIQISGDARQRIPKLFKFIRDQCNNSLSTLLVDTRVKLKRAVHDCRVDIRNDLEIVQGEQVPAEDESALTSQMFDVLQAAKIRRAEALRVFEASIRD